jgi:tRNA (guanine-N7-)-methyltransferase
MPACNPNGGRRRSAFFGRRKGHRLRPHQAELLVTLLPQLALDLDRPAPADLRSLFPQATDEVRMEIGFGSGEYLTAEAAQHSRAGFIGVEPFVNGMAKALAAIAAGGLQNVRLHHGDAADVLAWLPDASLTGIDLIYPDPWPKRRHWKRRFVQDARIAQLARILRPNGEFRFVTDIPDYAAWALSRLVRAPQFVWRAERAADWRQPWPGFDGTRYEAKAKREGRAPCYLVFRRI